MVLSTIVGPGDPARKAPYLQQYPGNGSVLDAAISSSRYRPPLSLGQSRASPTWMIMAPISPAPTVGVSTNLHTATSRSLLRSPVNSQVT